MRRHIRCAKLFLGLRTVLFRFQRRSSLCQRALCLTHPAGYCTTGLSWANATLRGLWLSGARRRDQATKDLDQRPRRSRFRFVSYQFSSFGRQYVFSHYIVHPSALWAIGGGTNFVDGRSIVGFAISLPPWQESNRPRNDFVKVPVKIGAGPQYAEVQFGYSRWVGPDGYRRSVPLHAARGGL